MPLRTTLFWLAAAGILASALLLAAIAGSSQLSASAAWDALFAGPGARSLPTEIVWGIRLPRAVVVGLAGAALSLSGGAMQALFRNPLVEPGLLGVSSGASVGAVIALFGASAADPWTLPFWAFLGAGAELALVFALSHLGGRPTTTITLLTGVAIGSFLTALIGAVLLLSQQYQLKQLLFWLAGGAEGRSWFHAAIASPPIALGAALLLACSRPLDALALGEEHALSLGVSIPRIRIFVLLGCALATGAAVSVCGPIGFVGLMVPHLVRFVAGGRSRVLLPGSALAGAAFLMLCDVLLRALLPADLQLGTITAFLGVPFFLWLLLRARREAVR